MAKKKPAHEGYKKRQKKRTLAHYRGLTAAAKDQNDMAGSGGGGGKNGGSKKNGGCLSAAIRLPVTILIVTYQATKRRLLSPSTS
jgi:hypothetical protein